MPTLSRFFMFVSGCLLASCSVQEVVTVSSLPPAAADTGSLRIASRTEEFLHLLSPQTFNGAVVLEKNGNLISGGGYGYAWYSQKLPFTTRTVSSTAHLARQFTAAAVLKLQENQKLDLNDSLYRFFNNIPPRFQGIKLIQLLENTSGLPNELPDHEKAKQKEAFLGAVWDLPLISPPGKEYHYSNVGYRLLAAVTEAASGMDYESFLRQDLFIPSGMYNTGYVLPDFQQALQAKSMENETDDEVEEFLYLQYKKDPQALWHLMGSSGMLSNSEDLFLWQQAVSKGSLLSSFGRNQLQSLSVKGRVEKPAPGWLLREGTGNAPVITHQSSQNGYFCQLMYLPEKNMSLVLLANQVNGQVENLGEQLVRMALFPFYVPAPLPYSSEKLVRIPQEGEAEHVRALLRYLQDSTRSEAGPLISTHFSPGFRSMVSDTGHKEALEQLHQRLGTASLEKAEQRLPFYMFTFFSPEAGFWYQLRVQVDPQQAYRINTIGLETTDALN